MSPNQSSPYSSQTRCSTLQKIYGSFPYLVMEFLLFYIFVPFIVNYFLPGWYKIIPLILIAGGFLFLLTRDPGFDRRVLFNFRRAYLGKSLLRMALISLLLLWFTWWIYPQLFLSYPLRHTGAYFLTFFLYPLCSVVPQEIIYRVYYFHRYGRLIPEKYLLMFSNAFIFGLTHLIYGNWVAPIASFLISWVFIHNYQKTASLWNVCLEHWIYGIIMFTVGLGHFFQ